MENEKQQAGCACAPELKKTTIGGQALIEGLMMVGPHKIALACRRRDGSITIDEMPPLKKGKASKIPIVRGAVNMFRQLVMGQKALMRSASFVEEDDRIEEAAEEAAKAAVTDTAVDAATEAGENSESGSTALGEKPVHKEKSKLTDVVLYLATIGGILGGVALFVLLPNFLASLILPISDEARQSFRTGFVYNLLEGAIRLVLLLGYMWMTSLVKDIREMWRYHGAEHKTIACYEAGEELTVENVLRYSRFHPRCGTSFLFLLVFMSVILFSVVGWYSTWINLLIRLVLVPVLAGLTYELLRWTGKNDKKPLCRILARPGLWVQRLTTAEPDGPIVEVAIAAMKAVIPEDGNDDNW